MRLNNKIIELLVVESIQKGYIAVQALSGINGSLDITIVTTEKLTDKGIRSKGVASKLLKMSLSMWYVQCTFLCILSLFLRYLL